MVRVPTASIKFPSLAQRCFPLDAHGTAVSGSWANQLVLAYGDACSVGLLVMVTGVARLQTTIAGGQDVQHDGQG